MSDTNTGERVQPCGCRYRTVSDGFVQRDRCLGHAVTDLQRSYERGNAALVSEVRHMAESLRDIAQLADDLRYSRHREEHGLGLMGRLRRRVRAWLAAE